MYFDLKKDNPNQNSSFLIKKTVSTPQTKAHTEIKKKTKSISQKEKKSFYEPYFDCCKLYIIQDEFLNKNPWKDRLVFSRYNWIVTLRTRK
jgi:hypothetical protein